MVQISNISGVKFRATDKTLSLKNRQNIIGLRLAGQSGLGIRKGDSSAMRNQYLQMREPSAIQVRFRADDLLDIPEMVSLPAGSFKKEVFENGTITVAISKPFRISSNLVSRDQFDQFLTAAGWKNKGVFFSWNKPAWGNERSGLDEHAGNIPWHGALSYCAWLGAKTGSAYRLPTLAEVEYAGSKGKILDSSYVGEWFQDCGWDPFEKSWWNQCEDVTDPEGGSIRNQRVVTIYDDHSHRKSVHWIDIQECPEDVGFRIVEVLT